MTDGLVFVDTETTGLDPDRHDVWEIALIDDKGETEYQLPVDLSSADPTALRINRFYERRNAMSQGRDLASFSARRTVPEVDWWSHGPRSIAEDIAVRLDGMTLVGANPAFDAAFLRRFLLDHGQAPMWSHRLLDIEAYAAAFCHGMPKSLRDTAGVLGVPVDEDGRHTALGDARLVKAIWDQVRPITN